MSDATNIWSKDELRALRKEYPNTTTKALADRLGRTLEAVRFQAKKHRLKKTKKYMQSLYESQRGKGRGHSEVNYNTLKKIISGPIKKVLSRPIKKILREKAPTINIWSKDELNTLKKEYPNTDTNDLAEKLGRTLEAVRFQAKKHRLNKTKKYMQSLYETQRKEESKPKKLGKVVKPDNAETNNSIKRILKTKLPVTLDKRERDLVEKAFLESIKHMEKEEYDFISSKIKKKIKSTSRARTTWISQMGSFYSVLFEACEHHNKKDLLSDNAHDLVGAALLYFVNPFDIIPDHIAGKGYADDFYVLQLCLKKIKGKDVDILNKYFEKLKK